MRGADCVKIKKNKKKVDIYSCRPREGCGLRLMKINVMSVEEFEVAVPVRGADCVSKTAQPKGIKLDAFHNP